MKVANNGREAVEILSNGPQPPPFDVVLMDLQMPEMDGYQATAKLRSDPRFATLPIIAMTAHATMEERQRCLAAGMNDHISKPIDPDNLFETVGRFYKPARSTRVPQWRAGRPITAPEAGALPTTPLRRRPRHEGRTEPCRRQSQALSETPPPVRRATRSSAYADRRGAGAERQVIAERLAHTVKGVAGNLGARSIQQVAGKLEKAIAAKTASAELTPLLHEFGSALNDFVSRAAHRVAVRGNSAAGSDCHCSR